MLERTVAGLEPCKLRRILPKAAARATKQRQRLRAGFWQHGALAIELSHGWPAVVSEKQQKKKKAPRSGGSDVQPVESELMASMFRLDFLYPTLHHDSGRRSPANTRRVPKYGNEKRRKYGTSADAPANTADNDAARTEEKTTSSQVEDELESSVDSDAPGTFGGEDSNITEPTSSTLPAEKENPRSGGEDGAPNHEQPHTAVFRTLESRSLGPDPESTSRDDPSDQVTAERTSEANEDGLLDDAQGSTPELPSHGEEPDPKPPSENANAPVVISYEKGIAEPSELDELLSQPGSSRHLDVYDTYKRLDPQHRPRYRPGVVVYLARSRNIVAHHRSLAMFRHISEDLWTNDVLAAGVSIFLRDSKRAVAMNIFQKGAQRAGLSGGLEQLLVDLFRSRFWSGVLKIWKIWYATQIKFGKGEPSAKMLEVISVLKTRLPGLYFSFEQYLAIDRHAELDPHTLKSDNKATNALRHRFAVMALERSSPKRAEVILAFYQSRKLYHNYLETMTMKWAKKEISRDVAVGLIKIYQNYHQQSNFKPSDTVLHGMFEIYYPHRLEGLEALHDDWCRAHGELSEHGFNKYFKLHAKLGNVAATRDLVERYQAKFPTKPKEEGALRLITVYARQGNVDAVRYITGSMSTDKISQLYQKIHSNLLMACVKSGQSDEAVEIFEEMDKFGVLSPADYAQIMHLWSKNGDVDATLQYFDMVQRNRVEITPGMVSALTLAFIGNDRLKDAELVVVQMADRGVTSTDIWNELIKANGIIGNMPRCYGILSVMRQRGLEFLPSTYEAVLAAMVRYGQINAATALLEDAARNNTFPPTAEHYAVVMAGAVRARDYASVPRLARKLEDSRLGPSFSSRVAQLGAAIKLGKSSQRAKILAKELVKTMRVLLGRKEDAVTSQTADSAVASIWGNSETIPSDASAISGLKQKLINVSPTSFTHATNRIGHAVALLVQLRDFFTVEEVISHFLELHPQKQGEPLPEGLMHSLMRAYYQDGQHQRVLATWETYWTQVSQYWVDDETGFAKPNKQFALVHILDLVTRSLRDLGDGEGIGQFVIRTYTAGFKMSSSNWNQVVQSLAELGHVESAMSWCEIILMPYWRGWQRFPDTRNHTPEYHKFARAIKRAHLDHHFMRPHQQAIMILRDKYIELQKLAVWDPVKARQLQGIEADNPRLVRAFEKTPRGFRSNQDRWQIQNTARFEARIDSFVNTLNLDQAKTMMTTLQRLHDADALHGPPERLREVLDGAAAEVTMATEAEADEPVEEERHFEAEMTDPESPLYKKLEEDRAKGDEILVQRMAAYRARTWRRDKYSRWGDQWAGWGDQMNAQP